MKQPTVDLTDFLSPPGDTIQEILDERGMKQTELAARMGRPREKINDVIKGREPVTIATAMQLEKVLGIPALFWMNREAQYRRELYALEEANRLTCELTWLANFPIKDLIRLGYLPSTGKKTVLVSQLLRFFGVASKAQWECFYGVHSESQALSASKPPHPDVYKFAVWLRIAEIQNERMSLPPFSKALFRQVLSEVRKLAVPESATPKEQLQALCSRAGASVVFVPSLAGLSLRGAVSWYRRRPQILLLNQYKNQHQFWSGFFDAAEHVLNQKNIKYTIRLT
jgi:HTH-type transcriptional regulator / antitoxin HigA